MHNRLLEDWLDDESEKITNWEKENKRNFLDFLLIWNGLDKGEEMAKFIHEMSEEELKRINKKWYIFVKKHNTKYIKSLGEEE